MTNWNFCFLCCNRALQTSRNPADGRTHEIYDVGRESSDDIFIKGDIILQRCYTLFEGVCPEWRHPFNFCILFFRMRMSKFTKLLWEVSEFKSENIISVSFVGIVTCSLITLNSVETKIVFLFTVYSSTNINMTFLTLFCFSF